MPTPYATDEDIALRASADFTLLCPRDQKVASGSDGAFSSSDPWTLTSATADFQALGVAAGQVVQIKSTGSGQPTDQDLVVVGTGPGAVTLRRKGQPAGVGMPPGAGGLSGLKFNTWTLGPQIALASTDINHRFGITDGRYPGHVAAELADPTELRDAVVLTVMYRQYLGISRVMNESPDMPGDNFAARARAIKAELDDLLARLALHWNPAPAGGLDSPTTRFSTRMSR